jgi:carotenoid cleavage dioxygenase-like enzyme
VLDRDMRMDTIRTEGLPSLKPRLHRITLAPGREDFAMEVVGAGVGFEFPATHHARVNARPHRYVWGSDLSRLVRVDTLTDGVTQRSLDDLTFGEPVFVPNPDAIEEDDGVLLTVGSSPRTPGSELTVWDARTLETLARIRVPIALPLGFHGGFESR